MAPRQRLTENTAEEDFSASLQQTSKGSQHTTPLATSNGHSSLSNGTSKKENEKEIAEKEEKLRRQRADDARDHHDYFNLVALPVMMAALMSRFGWNIFLSGVKGEGLCLDEGFMKAWMVTFGYFVADLLWVWTVPICVKSPTLIIKHHICALMYLCGPLIFPEYSCFLGSVISVEVNTYFLILRRVLYRQKDRVPAILATLNEMAFYISWILIRIVVYPLILYVFLQMAHARATEKGSIFQFCFAFILVHAFLVVLNIKWTYDLFCPIIKRFFSKEKTPLSAPGSL